jgi:hypothetical protein
LESTHCTQIPSGEQCAISPLHWASISQAVGGVHPCSTHTSPSGHVRCGSFATPMDAQSSDDVQQAAGFGFVQATVDARIASPVINNALNI